MKLVSLAPIELIPARDVQSEPELSSNRDTRRSFETPGRGTTTETENVSPRALLLLVTPSFSLSLCVCIAPSLFLVLHGIPALERGLFVIISCLAGQTTARARPKTPNCPLVFAR